MRKRSGRAMAGIWAGLALLASGLARAQTGELDSPKADPKHHVVAFENEYVRVVRWVIPPHEKTALHAHPGLVNVLLTDAHLKVTTADGKSSDVHGKARTAAWRGPVTHTVENVGARPAEGILVEPKKPGDPAWTAPPRDSAKVDPAHHQVEFENGEVRIERFSSAARAKTPMHEHPTNVLIFLTRAHSRSVDAAGKASEARWKPGQVAFRPAGAHEVQNLDGPFEGFVIALKDAPAKP